MFATALVLRVGAAARVAPLALPDSTTYVTYLPVPATGFQDSNTAEPLTLPVRLVGAGGQTTSLKVGTGPDANDGYERNRDHHKDIMEISVTRS